MFTSLKTLPNVGRQEIGKKITYIQTYLVITLKPYAKMASG